MPISDSRTGPRRSGVCQIACSFGGGEAGIQSVPLKRPCSPEAKTRAAVWAGPDGWMDAIVSMGSAETACVWQQPSEDCCGWGIAWNAEVLQQSVASGFW